MSATPDYDTVARLLGGDDCPLCGGPGSLVTPECTDGHGADCPDRLCLACGSALFVDPPLTMTVATTARGTRRPTARTA